MNAAERFLEMDLLCQEPERKNRERITRSGREVESTHVSEPG